MDEEGIDTNDSEDMKFNHNAKCVTAEKCHRHIEFSYVSRYPVNTHTHTHTIIESKTIKKTSNIKDQLEVKTK